MNFEERSQGSELKTLSLFIDGLGGKLKNARSEGGNFGGTYTMLVGEMTW